MSMLKTIGNGVKNSTLNRLDSSTWNKINVFGICSYRQRGCRAGRNKQRLIKPALDIFERSDKNAVRGVNFANLAPIAINHNQQNNLIHLCKPTNSDRHEAPPTKFASRNAWSIKEKTTPLVDFVIENNLDVVALQETWLTGTRKDNCTLADINSLLPNFCIFNTPRGTRGGGVSLLLKSGFSTRFNTSTSYASFEHIDYTISRNSSSLRLISLYRRQEIASIVFLNDFSMLLVGVLSSPEDVVISGDFNYHVDVVNDRDACAFKDLFDEVGLQQHVIGPTHRSGHTLDLIISGKESTLISDVSILQSLPIPL